jgi:hypothetical protein
MRRCAVHTHAAHGEVHAHVLIAQRLQRLQRSLRGPVQVIGVGFQGAGQRAVAVAALALKVRNGVHAGGHGLVPAHAVGVHPAQQQANLRQPVNQAVQVTRSSATPGVSVAVVRQRGLQLRVGVAGVGVGQQPAQNQARGAGPAQTVGRQQRIDGVRSGACGAETDAMAV